MFGDTHNSVDLWLTLIILFLVVVVVAGNDGVVAVHSANDGNTSVNSWCPVLCYCIVTV